jgi:probable F420-dependent oxidoreductase
MVRPFRFIATLPLLDRPVAEWRDELHRIEDFGFSTVAVSEHLTGGWTLEPLIALTAAASMTDRLGLLTLVLANDLRHPVMLHRAAATLDRISDGRLELGIGAGWLRADYDAAGLPFRPAAERIERLGETVRIVKCLFDETPDDPGVAERSPSSRPGQPRPDRPPIMIGGGGERILSLAAQEADIIGIHASLRGPAVDAAAARDLSAERVMAKVHWVRAELERSGRDPDAIDLQFTTYLTRIGDSAAAARRATSQFAQALGADEELVSTSPAVLAGSLDQCVETLLERRERYGFNYLKVAGSPSEVAPLVARLAGR